MYLFTLNSRAEIAYKYSRPYLVQMSHLSNWQLPQQQQFLCSVLPQTQRLKVTHIQLKTKELLISGSLIMLFTPKTLSTVKSFTV